MAAARPGPMFVYEQNVMNEIPLEYLDKNQGEDRFRGNYNLLSIIQMIKHTSRKIVQLHNKMMLRWNFIQAFYTTTSFREQKDCIIPLCHYTTLINYMRLAKTLSFKYPLFRRNGYTEDTDLHYYLNFWFTLENFVNESHIFFENVPNFQNKCEIEKKAIITCWANNIARNIFQLRKKIHVLPEYTPLLTMTPHPQFIKSTLREYFGVNKPGGGWAHFQNYPDNDTSDESDDESDNEYSQEEPETQFDIFESAERYYSSSTLHSAINPKVNKEWKKHKIQKCVVCNCFQDMSYFPYEGIPREIYFMSTESENSEFVGHYCHFHKKMEMKDGENSEDFGYSGDNEDSENNEDTEDFGDSEDYGDYEVNEEYEECVENEYSGDNEDNDYSEDGEDIEGRGKYVVTVPNHRFGTITNARIINALMKGRDPLAEFQNPNYVHANRADYNLRTIRGCNGIDTSSYKSGASSSNASNTNQERASNTSGNGEVPEDNAGPGLTINSEIFLEYVQQGWHNFPFDEAHGYMFPSFVKTITRYLYDMEPEGKDISLYYSHIFMKSCEILIKKAFKADPSTALYKMRFHLKLMPKIYKKTLKGLEEILQIGIQVIACDISNIYWVRRQMKDHFYDNLNMFNYECLSMLETAIHGVPGSW